MVTSFKKFILNEMITIRDIRKDNNKPFNALINFSNYGNSAHGKYLSLEPADNPGYDNERYHPSPEPGAKYGPSSKYNPQPPRHDLYFTKSHGVHVDPQTKTVNLDMSDQSLELNRRPNVKIGNDNHNKAKRSTPILHGQNELKDHELRKVLNSLKAHVPDIHEYTVTGDDRHEGKKVHEVVSAPTPNEQWIRGREPITFYHGTSEKQAKIIQEKGLHPGKRTEGYADLVPGYSEHNVYLTTHPEEASNYATRQAIHDKSKATILKVVIHPQHFDKLRPDEDNMNWVGSLPPTPKSKLLMQHPELKPHLTSSAFHYKGMNHTDPHSIPWNNEWVDENKPSHEDAETYKARLHTNIKAAFETTARLGKTTAYKGSVDPKHISHHATWALQSTKMDPDEDEYMAAREKMRATLRR